MASCNPEASILRANQSQRNSRSLPNNPLSPPSDPVQRRLQSPSAKSNFLAVRAVEVFEDQGGDLSRTLYVKLNK
jgi:hypothetical protein